MTDCPFCRIVQGLDSDAAVVGRGQGWLAFFPTGPAAVGHTLVIPIEHSTDYWNATPEAVACLAEGVHCVGRALRQCLAPDGLNLITSAGPSAEQSVFHTHMHLVPRWQDDDFGEIWEASTEPVSLPPDLVDRLRSVLI